MHPICTQESPFHSLQSSDEEIAITLKTYRWWKNVATKKNGNMMKLKEAELFGGDTEKTDTAS